VSGTDPATWPTAIAAAGHSAAKVNRVIQQQRKKVENGTGREKATRRFVTIFRGRLRPAAVQGAMGKAASGKGRTACSLRSPARRINQIKLGAGGGRHFPGDHTNPPSPFRLSLPCARGRGHHHRAPLEREARGKRPAFFPEGRAASGLVSKVGNSFPMGPFCAQKRFLGLFFFHFRSPAIFPRGPQALGPLFPKPSLPFFSFGV